MAAILGDGSIPDGAVAIKIDVDSVASMKGKGQYIYVSVASSEEAARATRPIVMFNNGHEGGASSELFGQGYEQNAGGMFQGLFEAKIKPALQKLLA